ncbi:HS12A-like protein [Mya arenaria]|uniref:HS12A-like protein n=1 Tax=Mya arenaria TaxID=6604 RepID=A0ABY7DXS3_MYAAR|nr:HS12A-like protein [Mya arenaria]
MSSSSKTKKTVSNKLVVAAIDVGTTFSGYAFSMNYDFNENPSKIHINCRWIGGGQLITNKTPTVLLLNPDRTFKAFGYDAESQYAELAEQDAERDDGKLFHKEHFYFRRFKMKLYKTKYLYQILVGRRQKTYLSKVIDDGHLKELVASGGAWGGTMVDKAFEDFIIKLFGIKSYEEFKKNHVEDLVDLQREFELKKRSISVSKEGKETLRLPVTLKKCKDIFAIHVKKGQELVVGQAQSTSRYSKLEEDQISLYFDIYTSPEEDPKFVDSAECTFLGKLEVEVPHEKSRAIGVFVSMIFGGTELTVIAKEEKSGKTTKAAFNFLK